MKLKPIREYLGDRYAVASRRALRGLFVAASVTATSLGGCGPGLDSRWVDSAVRNGELDDTVDDCGQADDPAACRETQGGDDAGR